MLLAKRWSPRRAGVPAWGAADPNGQARAVERALAAAWVP